ncbi:MAG: patatin-like phospholipase family protein [Bacteroidota bacterium]
MRNIENLVFKGGGVLGIAYAGALQVLENHNILDGIKGVAGTSAGSIVATLVSLKYSAPKIKEIVAATNFKKFEDGFNPLHIVTRYGLYDGNYFLNWLKGIIKDKTGNENITFAELTAAGYRDLRVFSTDLNTQNVREFSNATTPTVIVAEAVRASMSIPFFFEAWQFTNNNPDDHLYVDGGTVYNYPITAFKPIKNTLGFFLQSKHPKTSDLGYDSIIQYVKTLFETLMNAQNIDFEKDKIENEVTVRIDDLGISAIDFDITKEQETALYNSGFQATEAYLKLHP